MQNIIIILIFILLYTIIYNIIIHFLEKDENIFLNLFYCFVIISTMIISLELPIAFMVYNLVFLTITIMYFAEVLNVKAYKQLRYLYPLFHMIFIVILTVYSGELSIIEKVLYAYKNHVCNEIYNNMCILFQLQFDSLPSNVVETPDFCSKPIVGAKADISYNLIWGEGKQLGKAILTTAKSFLPQVGLVKQTTVKKELPPEMEAYAENIFDNLHKTLIPKPCLGFQLINNAGILCSTCYNNKQNIETTLACLKTEEYRNKFLFIKDSFFSTPGKYSTDFDKDYYRFWNYINHHQVEACLNEIPIKLKITAEVKETSYEDLSNIHPLPNDYKSGDLILMSKDTKGFVPISLLELKVTGELSNNRVAEYKYKIFDKIPPGIDIRKEALILCGDKIDPEKASILRYELWKRGITISYYYAGDLDYNNKLTEDAIKNFSKLGRGYDEAYRARIKCIKDLWLKKE